MKTQNYVIFSERFWSSYSEVPAIQNFLLVIRGGDFFLDPDYNIIEIKDIHQKDLCTIIEIWVFFLELLVDKKLAPSHLQRHFKF